MGPPGMGGAIPMMQPPGQGAGPLPPRMGAPPSRPSLPGTTPPSARAGQPFGGGYVQPAVGMSGDFDQPLAETFRALTVSSGPGGGSVISPAELQRPTPEELAEPMRLDTRGDSGRQRGQCPPKYMRMTTNALPNSPATKGKAALPLGAIIKPMARDDAAPVAVVNFGAVGVVRCRRCRTYVNPFVTFIDGGRRWRCNVCSLANDCPSDYICDLDEHGVRRDVAERPELSSGVVEFVAPAEYMVRPPQPPVFLFVVEVSYAAVSSGMLRCVAATLAHTIDHLPGGERTQVGVITYDSTLHFYNLHGSTPQMLVVPELDEPFCPMPGEALVNLSERRDVVKQLLEKLPSMFGATQATEVATGPALKAAYTVAQHVGGKVSLFSATRPTVGDGKLLNREGAGGAANGKGAEGGGLLAPACDFYKTLAVDCSKQQLCIDVWACHSAYADLATLALLARHTGGSVQHFPAFSDVAAGERLSRALQHSLTREQGLEAVMRVRASRGLRIAAFYGHFFIRGVDLLALPNVDEDKSFAVEIAHEENEIGASTACLQAALLYTTTSGERRIRVLTLELPVTSALNSIFDSADVDACVALTARLAAEATLSASPLTGAEKLQNACLEALRAYRSLCPPHAKTTAALLLPENLRLLPLYTLAAMKAALYASPAEARADERAALIATIANASATEATVLAHPRLFQAYPPLEKGPNGLPAPLPLSAQSVQTNVAYLLDDGAQLSLWFGRDVPSEMLQAAFGWPSLQGVDLATLRLLPPNTSPVAAEIHALVDAARVGRPAGWTPLRVLVQGTSDAPFVRALIEDQTKQMMSYPEFLLHCHRYILSKA